MTHATERDAFLRAIAADLSDDTTRLVAADWFEEHGEERFAVFLRADGLRTAIRTGKAIGECFERAARLAGEVARVITEAVAPALAAIVQYVTPVLEEHPRERRRLPGRYSYQPPR